MFYIINACVRVNTYDDTCSMRVGFILLQRLVPSLAGSLAVPVTFYFFLTCRFHPVIHTRHSTTRSFIHSFAHTSVKHRSIRNALFQQRSSLPVVVLSFICMCVSVHVSLNNGYGTCWSSSSSEQHSSYMDGHVVHSSYIASCCRCCRGSSDSAEKCWETAGQRWNLCVPPPA